MAGNADSAGTRRGVAGAEEGIVSGYPLNRIQQTWNLIRHAADEASALAHAPENRRNSTGTFEGGKKVGLELALSIIVQQYPDDLPCPGAGMDIDPDDDACYSPGALYGPPE